MYYSLRSTLFLWFIITVFQLTYVWTQAGPDTVQKPGTLFKGRDRSVVERKLREQLLERYNKAIMPNSNNSQIFLVRSEMILTGIQEVDVRNQRMHVTAWIKMEWWDQRLIWNSTEHSDLLSLPFNQEDLYLPEILLFNRYRARNADLFGTSMAVAYCHGEVLWLPAASLEVPCTMDLSTWPYDSHECVFVFGHASRDNSTFEIYADSDTVSLDSFASSHVDWKVVKSRTARFQHYNNVGDGYDNVRFYITVQRTPLPFLSSVFYAPKMLLLTSVVILWISDINFRTLYAAGELTASLILAACCYSIIPPARQAPKLVYLLVGTPMLVFTALICSLLVDAFAACQYPYPFYLDPLSVPASTRTWSGISKLRSLWRGSTAVTSRRPDNGQLYPATSTEQLVLTDVREPVHGDSNQKWIFLSSNLRIAFFVMYCAACGLLLILVR